MPTIPCCTRISCPPDSIGNLEFDSPLANLSSEAPDQDIFIGLNTGWDHWVPPIGSNWTKNSCLGLCTSTVSQQDADDCAARNNLLCLMNDGWGTPPGQVPTGGPSSGPPLIPPPPGFPPQLFTNQQQACTAHCPDGSPFVWQVGFGTFIGQSLAQANAMAFSRACNLAALNKICVTDLAPGVACSNAPYNGRATITGGTAPYTVTGAPPAGLSIAQSTDGKTLFFAGTVTATSNQTFTLTITDANGNFQQKTFTLKVLNITGTPPNGQVGVAYSFQFTGSGGDGGPYSFQGFQPPPPPGLGILPDGTLSGTPQGPIGTFPFGVGIIDKNGNTCGIQSAITIVGACNQDQAGTSFCPANPGITTHIDVPAGTFCGPVGTNQNFLDSQAQQSMLQQLHDAQAAKGCLCPGPTMSAPSASQSGVMNNACGQFWVTDTVPAGPIFVPAGNFDWVNWWEVNNGIALHGHFHAIPFDFAGPSLLIFKV
jgi:hypothetical protein